MYHFHFHCFFSHPYGGYELNETLFSLLVTMVIWQQKKMEFQNWQQQILHFPSGGKKEGRIFQTFLPQQNRLHLSTLDKCKRDNRSYDLFT